MIVKAVGEKARGATVLDAGCGPDLLYPEILEASAKYVAMDLSPGNLEEFAANIQSPKLECTCIDLDTFDWPQEFFDVIICSGAIEYTANAESNLVGMMDALKVGGLLVCSFPNLCSPYRIWGECIYSPLSRLYHRLRGKPSNTYPRTLFSPARVREIFSSCSLHLEEEYLGYKFLLQPLDSMFCRCDYWITSYFQQHPSRALKRHASEFLIIGHKNSA